MKLLRFNLRTLLVATALLAAIMYITMRVRQHLIVGSISDGWYALQVEQDESGMLFTITASSEPITSLVVELYEEHPSYETLVFGTGSIAVEPYHRKQLRLVRNVGQFPAVEMQGSLPIVRLPERLGNGFYQLRIPYGENYQHLGEVRYGDGNNRVFFQNEHGLKYCLVIFVNPVSARNQLIPNP